MTSAEALETIRTAAMRYAWRISGHALARMRERGAEVPDLMHAVAKATGITAQENARWKVVGPDRDGDELVVVAAIDGDVVVVTVF